MVNIDLAIEAQTERKASRLETAVEVPPLQPGTNEFLGDGKLIPRGYLTWE